MAVEICVIRENYAQDLPLPAYATPGSAGMDLVAALPEHNPVLLNPGSRALITTGIRLSIPAGYEGQIRPRSGLALKHGIALLNSPGTIDSDYRGVVQALLINLGDQPFSIKRGDRIAQLVISPVIHAVLVEGESLPQSIRGEGGFGSTGTTTNSPNLPSTERQNE